MADKIYLDAQGNPIKKTYLDAQGNPIKDEPAAPSRSWTDVAVESLPTVGGALGGIVGGIGGTAFGMGIGGVPGAVGGAALGGGAGEAARQLIERYRGKTVPTSATEAATGIGQEGATQGALEAGGALAGKLMMKGGERLYQSVLKPVLGARAENKALIQTGLKHAIPVSQAGEAKAGRLVQASMSDADKLVAEAAAKPGAPLIYPQQSARGLRTAVENIEDLNVAGPQKRAIGDYGRQFMQEHTVPIQRPVTTTKPPIGFTGQPVSTTTMQTVGRKAIPRTLPDIQESVRASDKFYNKAYRSALDKSDAVAVGSTAAAMGINDQNRELLRAAVPGLRGQNAQTAAIEGVRQAIERRVGKEGSDLGTRGNLSAVGMQHFINAGLAGGATAYGGKERGLETFLAAEALTNPAIASRLAIGAAKASKIPYSQALRAAVLARLAGEQPEEK